MLVYTEKDIDLTPYSKLSSFSHAKILHGHTFYEIALILSGTAVSTVNFGQPRMLKPGDLIFIRPGDCHSIQSSSRDYRHRDFYVTPAKMKRLLSVFDADFRAALTEPKREISWHLDQIETDRIDKKARIFDTTAPTAATRSLLEGIHSSLIIELLGEKVFEELPPPKNIPVWLSDLWTHLQSFHYASLSVEEVVARTGYSHSYVCQLFKKTYHTTLREALIKSKVLLSAEMLGKVKVIDVAAAFGWENPKNYSIAFRKVFGVSPRAYQKLRTGGGQPIFTNPPHISDIRDFQTILGLPEDT